MQPKQPIDYVKSDERLNTDDLKNMKPGQWLPQAERRPDQGSLVAALVFAGAGLIVGFVSCFLWMTVGW